MLTFSDAEPIIEAKKVPVKYRYYIPIIAMTDMLIRLTYDPDTLFIKNGWWDIELPIEYADDLAYALPPSRVVGIGFFENFNDNTPSIVMDTEKQIVHILDKRHLNEIATKSNRVTSPFTISFDLVFGHKITWADIVKEASKY